MGSAIKRSGDRSKSLKVKRPGRALFLVPGCRGHAGKTSVIEAPLPGREKNVLKKRECVEKTRPQIVTAAASKRKRRARFGRGRQRAKRRSLFESEAAKSKRITASSNQQTANDKARASGALRNAACAGLRLKADNRERSVRVERTENARAGGVRHLGQVARDAVEERPGKPRKGHRLDVHGINA